MRINKISKSDSFDLYAETIGSFIEKKEAKLSGGILKEAFLKHVYRFFKAVGDAPSDILKSIDIISGGAVPRRLGTMEEVLNSGKRIEDLANGPAAIAKYLDEVTEVSKRHADLARNYLDNDAIVEIFGSQKNLEDFHKLLILRASRAGEIGGDAKIKMITLQQSLGSSGAEIVDPNIQRVYADIIAEAPTSKLPWDEVLRRAGKTPEAPPRPKGDLPPEAGPRRTPADTRVPKETRSILGRLTDWIRGAPDLRGAKNVDDLAAHHRVVGESVTETLTLLSKKVDDLTLAGKYDDAAKLSGDIAKAKELQIREIEKALKKIDEMSLSKADKKRMKDLYNAQLKSIKGNADSLISKIAKWAGMSTLAGAAITALKYVAAAAAVIAAGVYGSDYLFGEDGVFTGEDKDKDKLTKDPDDIVTIDPAEIDAERAFNDNDHDKIQEMLSDPAITDKRLKYFANKYNKEKAYKLPQPFEGMNYVFMTDKAGGLDIDDPALQSTNLELLIEALSNRKTGLPIYRSLESSMQSPQHALNEAAEEILEKGLYRKRRSRRYDLGKGTSGRRGISGFSDKNLSREQRKMKRKERKRASVTSDRFEKISQLKEFSLDSTNNHLNNDINLLKKADDVSKSYVKDAVKDLTNEDKTLREYFTGLGRLYDAESEKRNRDYEELYKLHDETGRDLTLSAHPKAIRVSDAMGNGGLVENGLEQKEKLEDVALSAPTGNFKSRYAKLKNLLIKSSKT